MTQREALLWLFIVAIIIEALLLGWFFYVFNKHNKP